MKTIMKVFLFALFALMTHLHAAEAQIYPLGFSAEEVKTVYSDKFEVQGSKKWPISKDVLNTVIDWNQADPETKILYGEFKYLGDSKGYIHLGKDLDQDKYNQLHSILTDLNMYTELRMDEQPIFQDILAVDANGRPITSTFISGNSPGKTMYAQVLVVTQGIRLKVDMQINILEAEDGLTLELFNFHPINYGILGQIFGAQDFYVRVDFAAFDKGWLFRGISKFNPSSFLARMIKDPTSLAYGGQMLDWLEPYIVEPL